VGISHFILQASKIRLLSITYKKILRLWPFMGQIGKHLLLKPFIVLVDLVFLWRDDVL
jgi:hypothetical protein